jgi:hypothetical protein
LREQHRGWFYLNQLLDGWSDHFGEFRQEIQGVRSLMQRHAEYLAVVYNSASSAIQARRLNGEEFLRCDGCGHPAAARTPLSTSVSILNCVVCQITDSHISFSCEHGDCGQTIEIRGNHPGQRTCPSCRTFYSNSDLAVVLDELVIDAFDYKPRNCALCVTPDSVVQNGDAYVCTECLTVDDNIYLCQWCSELQMGGGDLEHSYYAGCEFCDGKAGWEGEG